MAFHPDRELNPRYRNVPDLDRYGAVITHPTPDGRPCSGQLTFDSLQARVADPTREKWTVEEWDPLTLSPSVLCGTCGDHGWVGAGRWQPAE
jgi:hypothetical protein